MQNTTRYVLLSLLTLALIIVFMPIFAYIHLYWWHDVSSGWIGTTEQWAVIISIIDAYVFVIPLSLTIFFPKPQKYYAIASLLGIILVVSLSDLMLVIMAYGPIALCGWLLGEGILWLYNKLKK